MKRLQGKFKMNHSAIMYCLLLLLFFRTAVAEDVIVVGAGPAGIAAASKLLENNLSVIVLEAEGRYGGRVNSVNFGEAVVDLGAEWCHGEKDNVVYDMVKDLGVLASSNFHFRLYSSDRKPVDEDFSYELHDLFDSLYTPGSAKEQEEGVSIGEYFIRAYNASVRSHYEDEPEKIKFALATLECFHHYVLSSEGAFSWFDTSATNDYKDCQGDLNLNWQGQGYKTALEILLRNFPNYDSTFKLRDLIKLKKKVKRIFWNKAGRQEVDVVCADGSLYHAKHVIFTPSLGVLKSKHVKLFDPPLPPKKVKAIRELGIAAVAKVMMHFPNRWWPKENFTGYSFVWQYDHKEMLAAEFSRGPQKYGRSWLLDLYGVYPVEKNPQVLSAWFTGHMVPDIELIDDNTLIDGILFVLDKFLGHESKISRPDMFLRSNWYSNPNFKGTYSFQTIASRKNNYSSNYALSKPLLNQQNVPTLLFAGEATHTHYYSTVHGAIETGWREANRILGYYRNYS